ncbi:hypothetical protein IFR04_002346 [Cadophora malorum]|uniref:Uncharacterized protein n=1 Tax=Cadophora malorum TaxID=108018 RepID=A0A8H7WGF8_9HELO|nr:hypothetical protein IFR04_002346 [Cadophora malorum]
MDDGWEMVPINDSSDVMDEYVVSERRLFNFKTGKMIWISNAPMMNKELKFGKKEAPHPPSPPFRWRPEVLERIRRLIVDQSLWGDWHSGPNKDFGQSDENFPLTMTGKKLSSVYPN